MGKREHCLSTLGVVEPWLQHSPGPPFPAAEGRRVVPALSVTPPHHKSHDPTLHKQEPWVSPSTHLVTQRRRSLPPAQRHRCTVARLHGVRVQRRR